MDVCCTSRSSRSRQPESRIGVQELLGLVTSSRTSKVAPKRLSVAQSSFVAPLSPQAGGDFYPSVGFPSVIFEQDDILLLRTRIERIAQRLLFSFLWLSTEMVGSMVPSARLALVANSSPRERGTRTDFGGPFLRRGLWQCSHHLFPSSSLLFSSPHLQSAASLPMTINPGPQISSFTSRSCSKSSPP